MTFRPGYTSLDLGTRLLIRSFRRGIRIFRSQDTNIVSRHQVFQENVPYKILLFSMCFSLLFSLSVQGVKPTSLYRRAQSTLPRSPCIETRVSHTPESLAAADRSSGNHPTTPLKKRLKKN